MPWVDGTPPRNLFIGQLVERQITEMLGLCKGIICDGVVNDAETVALKQWMRANPDATVTYPGNHLATRLVHMLEDGVIDEDERSELRDLLFDLTGERPDLESDMNGPATFPLDVPPPTLFFDRKEYVFTGIFAAGSRKFCESQVVQRGGRVSASLTGRADVLVIGVMSSPAWIESTHGRKIEAAMRMKQQGHRIAIVSEPHWLEALQIDA